MNKWEKYIKAFLKLSPKNQAPEYQILKNQHPSLIQPISLEKLNILEIFNTNQFKTKLRTSF